ncbi:U2 snRNP-associated SURP motif-containing protein [Hypsibius exemplaris]|uniref:U2 snRNP-associated SURP motif-containing protein n=1 Tax=Hypsibius exemplaris TaxID=2072580 RepID=A0A1W0X480_HYPEX|nr:U2 snRNP-associated SURP motif-containing protein [Hypsibius exemplaris]
MSAQKRPLSKREIEEVKKKDDLKRSAEVFSDFIQAFEEDTEPTKKFTTFVRGGVVQPGKGETPLDASSADNLYIHKPKHSSHSSSSQSTSHSHSKDHRSSKSSESHPPPSSSSSSSKPVLVKKPTDKKKSNLEIFKEELRQIQEEREERKRLKDQISKIETKLGTSVTLPRSSSVFLDDDNRVFDGTYDLSGDASSTNLYMGNIAPGVTEDQICQAFGKYGPIASVKIMYPRGEEKSESRGGRNSLCGFVAFMCRMDAERALYNLRGKEVFGCEMRLGWGKVVAIPTFPIYVPPRLAEALEPPPFSGLPFNAQPDSDEDWDRLPKDDEPPLDFAATVDILSRSTVRVVQPSERAILSTIHRVIEFIVREGPMFEAMLMQREKGNPQYRFLFDNRSNEHVYFRWKLFSILQGETPTQWRTKEFRMFAGGPMWKPPPVNPYSSGMPEELVEKGDETAYVREPRSRRGGGSSRDRKDHPVSSGKAGLSESDRTKLTQMLNDLTPSRDSVADTMVFCIDHADVADDIMATIVTSLQSEEDSPLKKVAKIYLISDILHNCSGVHVQNAWYYRNGFEQKFPFIFTQLRQSYRSIEGRLKAEQYKQRVMNCFRAWEDWALYPPKYLIKLQNIFLGLEAGEAPEENLFDGKPLVEPQSAAATATAASTTADADVDGVPMEDDLDGEPMDESEPAVDVKEAPVAFAPSRWESVDPEQVKAQAITTSKWDQVEPQLSGGNGNGPGETENTQQEAKKLDDHVREKLREIEMRVMKYQDDVETGKRSRHAGETLTEQVAKYRKQLLGSSPSSRSALAPPAAAPSLSSASKERSSRESREKRSAKRSRSRSPSTRSKAAPPSVSRSSTSQLDSRKPSASSSSSTSSAQRRRSRSRSRDRRH